MSKILIITNHSYMLWQFRRELIAKLMETNEVVLSMPFVGHEDDFQAMGLRCIETKIDRRGVNPATDVKLFAEYRKMLQKERPDLVITYSIKPNIYAGIICGQMGIPFCANVQGLGTAFQKPGLAQFVTALYKLSFRNVRTVFFENEENAAEFRRRHIVPRAKQKILKGAGINLESYPYQPYPQNDTVHFLYLGRLMKEKGMEELFSAAERLHRDGEKFFLDLVGFFEDEYKEQVKRMEAEGIVKFHGFQENPRPWYAAADCVVLPSYHEGMSNVLLEAAATGRPLITSDISGCREAVDDGTTGILVEVKDSDSLYCAMKHFLSLTREQREQMGRFGREKMEQEFPKEAIVRETIEALELGDSKKGQAGMQRCGRRGRSDRDINDGQKVNEHNIDEMGCEVKDGRSREKDRRAVDGCYELTKKQQGYLPLKRAMDVVIAGAFTVISAPFMGAIALAIKLDSPGPVLFKQERVGKDKETFEFWKFRTMRTDAPHDVPTHLLQNPDAYITRPGRFLREYSLDELPQFWQVLFRNDMSVIGPRPALWNQDDLIAERDKYGANSVKPGITGWAQVNGRDELEIDTKARFDGEYVKQMGFRMDVKCFLATIGSVLCHDGVVEGGTGELHMEGKETGPEWNGRVSPEKLNREIKMGAAVIGLSAAAVVGAAAAIRKFRKRK